MAKEKTKAELLQELNASLEEKVLQLTSENEKLLAEVRQAKSEVTQIGAAKKQLESFDELKQKNISLQDKVEKLEMANKYQEEQIKVLLNGLNQSNVSISQFFANQEYILKLAKENYDKLFVTIQGELDNIKKGE